MPTKDELEQENSSLQRKVVRLEGQLAKALEQAAKAEAVPAEEPVALEAPSPVDRGQMYVESHPTLGVMRTATVVKQSKGDGLPGTAAEIVRE